MDSLEVEVDVSENFTAWGRSMLTGPSGPTSTLN
jgi:hypothetical protein